WEGWVISLRQKQKKLIMLPSETMIWQPEFTDKTLSRKTGAVQSSITSELSAISLNSLSKSMLTPTSVKA
ncbi:hypothetical protein NMV76_22225, partial [Escherichia coli]|uniref:hypothetical protein n=1 Tax=Escherichia coli TaxID=562 RepID=UPI002245EC1E